MSHADEYTRAYAFGQLKRRLLRSSWAFVLAAIGFGYKRSFGFPVDGTDLFLGLALAALLAWVAYGAFVGTPEDELLWRRAIADRRWTEALGLLPRMQRVVPPPHVPLLRAQALAGLGHAGQAQRLIDEVDRNLVSTWEFWALVAKVRAASGDVAGRRAALETAIPVTPNPRDVLFALADLRAIEDADADGAQALLGQVHDRAMPAPLAAHRIVLEGMIAYEAGRLGEAEALLERSLRAIDEEIEASPELAEHRAKVHGYLAMLTARTNRIGEARVHARDWVPELKRRKQDTLARRVQESLRARSA